MNDLYNEDYLNTLYSYNHYPVKRGENSKFNEFYRHDTYSLQDNDYSSMNSDSIQMSKINQRIDMFYNPNEGFSKGNMQINIYKPYKITNPTIPSVYNEKEKILLEIQKNEFAMWDLNLYLNTHPTDKNAMMLFDQYRNLYKKYKQEYEEKYPPLSLENTSTSSSYWAWNKCPWPWEGE